MTRHGVRRLGAGVLVTLTLSLGGCAPSLGDDDGPSGPGAERESLRTSDLTFPLDEFDISEAHADVLLRAQAALVEECMARFGIHYGHPLSAVDGTVHEGLRDDRRYGLSDPDHAEEHGYLRQETDATPDPEADAAESVEELGPYGELALLGAEDQTPGALPGNQREAEELMANDPTPVTVADEPVPPGGCLRESALKMYAPTEESIDVQWVGGLAADAYVLAREEPAVRDAVDDWSQCMAAEGYRVDDPVTAAAELGYTADGQQPQNGPQARAAAVRDVACKQQSALVGTWAEEETRHQQRLVEQHAEQLAEFKKQRYQRMRFAEELLGGSYR